MSRVSEETWLLAYDIRQPRRLRRVHRLVKAHTVQVQYSAYLYVGSPTGLQSLLSELRDIINPAVDDVRCYHLGQHCPVWALGRQGFPDGVTLDGPAISALLKPKQGKHQL